MAGEQEPIRAARRDTSRIVASNERKIRLVNYMVLLVGRETEPTLLTWYGSIIIHITNRGLRPMSLKLICRSILEHILHKIVLYLLINFSGKKAPRLIAKIAFFFLTVNQVRLYSSIL
jgi:hypothetical protein